MRRFCRMLRLASAVLAVAVLALLLTAPFAQASGSYCPLPPRGPVVLDSARYDLGKHVFAADLPLPAPAGDVSAQRAHLDSLTARLPVAVRERAKLSELAGRLDRKQLGALEYFLHVRYKLP